MIFGLRAAPDVSTTGLNPYTNTGDPVVALRAQLNRFVDKSIRRPCAPNTPMMITGAFPLIPTLDDRTATIANAIVYDSLTCLSDSSLIDSTGGVAVRRGLSTDVIAWAAANLGEITVRIAQVADANGLAPAPVGITARDPNIPMPPSSNGPWIALGVVAVLAAAAGVFALTRRAP